MIFLHIFVQHLLKRTFLYRFFSVKVVVSSGNEAFGSNGERFNYFYYLHQNPCE